MKTSTGATPDLRRARELLEWVLFGGPDPWGEEAGPAVAPDEPPPVIAPKDSAESCACGTAACAGSDSAGAMVPNATPLTAKDVRDPRIDVFAQRALIRISKDPAMSMDAHAMLSAVKGGTLGGIYKEDERVPALRAKAWGTWWGTIIPTGQDAAVLLDPKDPVKGLSVIAFRDSVRSASARLDPALLNAGRTVQRLIQSAPLLRLCRTEQRGATSLTAGAEPAPIPDNVVPPVLCIAAIELVEPADGTIFFISDEPRMPEIPVMGRVAGLDPNTAGATILEWTAVIEFQGNQCRNGPNREVVTPPVHITTKNNERSVIRFPSVRGGTLTLTVKASVDGCLLREKSRGLEIHGTNPPRTLVVRTLGRTILARMACLESGLRQFHARVDGGTGRCPLFSGDRKGGVGIMQITDPPPTDDEIWDWSANARRGARLFQEKLAAARRYPEEIRGSRKFRELVDALNRARLAGGRDPLRVIVPNLTAAQAELDAVRGYNGYAGHDYFGLRLHEHRLVMNGNRLDLLVDEVSRTGTAIWERTPIHARPATRGAPDYVNRVLSTKCW